ncbi:hypothetical protein J4Q44_G00229920 [Coregonus suidteri]|uniref:Uncharacterized protein n=1 Tax=Coregonus suidteri TaxID=861788 RepID=A0AAN8QYA2_9TELE
MAWKSRTRSLQEFDTELSAYTVEWCPIPHWQNILACGTYLQKGHNYIRGQTWDQRRRLLGLADCTSSSFVNRDLSPMSCSELTPAILDQKLCHVPVSERPVLCMATASGELQLHIRLRGLCCAWLQPVGSYSCTYV